MCYSFEYDEEIIEPLSESIQTLKFGYYFNKSLVGKLPKKLIQLILNYGYDLDLKGALPSTLKYLTIDGWYTYTLTGCLPDSLIELNLNLRIFSEFSIFPSNLLKLRIFYDEYYPVKSDHFPPNLTYLDYNGPIDCQLPNSLISLTLYATNINESIYKFLPKSIKFLYLFDFHSMYTYSSLYPSGIDIYKNFIKNIPNNIEYIELANYSYLQYFPNEIHQIEINNFHKIIESNLHHHFSENSLYFVRNKE